MDVPQQSHILAIFLYIYVADCLWIVQDVINVGIQRETR